MSSPGFKVALDHQIPVMMQATQMNGDHGGGGGSGAGGGGQCGLTSLLPLSCRGRAAAFARDLHTRLRSLGTSGDEPDLAWQRDQPAPRTHLSPVAPRELDTFYDFELECESPSSPVDEFDAPFPERAAPPNPEPSFYDVVSEPEQNSPQSTPQLKPMTNGFTFSTAFYTESSPVRSQQQLSRENSIVEKQLYSPITFEGCARKNSTDEIALLTNSNDKDVTDSITNSTHMGLENLSIVNAQSSLDSDSEFESARSEPPEDLEEVQWNKNNLTTNAEDEICLEDDYIETIEKEEESEKNENIVIPELSNGSLEIQIIEASCEPEVSTPVEVPLLLQCSETVDEDREEEDDKPQRVRRCSSLKSGKTPPGTPGRKKIVRFADVLGLDLADVKTFMDEIPVIPTSAYDDLKGADLIAASPQVRAPPRLNTLTLVPLFQVPRDLTDRLERFNVCLESATVSEGMHTSICGSVRVRNLDFHKTVHIRYTMNRWKTFTDLQATYVPGTCDGFSDKFQFVLYTTCISSGQRLEIAVRFQCKGQQFWDNNSGVNYCFDCLALGAVGINGLTHPGALHPTTDWHPSFY